MILVPYNNKKPRVSSKAFVAPTAVLVGDVIVEDGASIWFGAVLRADMGSILVKKGANVQDNCVVHLKLFGSQAVIGENATIGHGAILHDCTIGKGAIVGINSVVLDFAQVGEESIVAAGSVVGDNAVIPPRHLAAGTPAEVKKEISGTALWYVKQGAEIYHLLRDEYLKEGIGVVEEEEEEEEEENESD
ncbi:MAG: gamma carbonic anhydrase family protein [Bacillota bacterium]|nr:gamma carbonic anhydrase family protein [Bacillota bacterium]